MTNGLVRRMSGFYKNETYIYLGPEVNHLHYGPDHDVGHVRFFNSGAVSTHVGIHIGHTKNASAFSAGMLTKDRTTISCTDVKLPLKLSQALR